METRGSRVRATMSDTFWILILSIVVLFAFTAGSCVAAREAFDG